MNALLNSLLHNCVKREEMTPSWLPDKGANYHDIAIAEKKLASNENRRYIYQNYCATCTCRTNCKIIGYRHWKKINTIINRFPTGEVEIIRFDEPLKCIDENVNQENVGGRNYIEIDGILFPKDENASNAKFLENMSNSARQSVDKYWGFAKSNEWDYFITLTCDPKKVDRFDDDKVKELWTYCRKKIQRFDCNAKILLVWERHKKENEYGQKALHAHGFVSMQRAFMLRQMKDRNGKWMYSNTGAALFEFPFWDYGLATCAIIPKGKDENGNDITQGAVVSYLSKYMSKSEISEVGYGKKRFHHTTNLAFKEKGMYCMDSDTFEESIGDDFEIYKKDDKGRTYYRSKRH